MKTKYLLVVLSAFFLLPWAVLLLDSDGIVGMSAAEADVLFSGDSDVYDGMWHFWWVRTALGSGTDPRIYNGNSLAWHNMGWPDLFFTWITGSSYNFMLFAGSLFSGWAGYLLARSWGTGKTGSLLTAFIIIWMPVRLVRVYQHYMLAGVGYVVLALYGFRKGFVSGKRKYAVLLFFSTILTVLQSLSFLLILAAGYVVTFVLTKGVSLKRKLIIALVAFAGGIVALTWFFTAPSVFNTSPEMDWKEAVHWAAEPHWYLFPSFLGQPLVIDTMSNPFEGVVSPGLTVSILALIFVYRKKSWIALVCALGIVLLSMGPLLKLGGQVSAIPLPFMAIARTPFLSAARTPSRFALIYGLMAALAAGKFLEKRSAITAWVFTILIAVELVPVNLCTIDNTVPSCYFSTDNYLPATMEIPVSRRIRKYSLFQISDGAPRKIMFLARGGPWQEESIPASLLWGSNTAPDLNHLTVSGAGRVIYNRWLFDDSIRSHYDALYDDIFPEQGKSDSVWIWSAL